MGSPAKASSSATSGPGNSGNCPAASAMPAPGANILPIQAACALLGVSFSAAAL